MLDSVYTNNFIKTLKEQNRLNENKFLLIYYEDEIKYIEYEFRKNIISARRKSSIFKRSEEYKLLCENISTDDEVFIHYLSTEFVWVVLGTKAKEYNWSLWGGDFYPYCNVDLYEDETIKIINKIHMNEEKELKNKIKEYISFQLRKRAINKIDYMLSWNNYDYELVQRRFSATKAKFKYFVYPKINDYELFDRIANNKNNKKEIVIQIGNSGNCTNNHISVLKKLTKYSGAYNFKIIAPLSYGDKAYIEEVIKEGKNLFGDQFQPVTEHIPLSEYYNILNMVDVAIMNHHRQEGAGNIITLLYLGKKVYLNKEITTYNTFKEWGLKVYNIESILESDFHEFYNISESVKELNKKIIKEKFNNDAVF
jgi:hypothetical protein